MDKKITKLDDGVEFVYKQNENTPRVAFVFNYSINESEKISGTYLTMARLFMQGTKTRTAEQIAQELDRYAIDFSADLKSDFLQFKFVCLNEDFSKALEIITDIIKNTTFDDFEREIKKLEGELIAELDAPRSKALDNYYKTLYKGHHYGCTNTVLLENIEKIKKEDVINGYEKFKNNSRKVITLFGDINYEKTFDMLNESFGSISSQSNFAIDCPVLTDKKEVEVIKSDLNQAHIIQGWLVPTFEHEDCPALILLNLILGASGLSSRLFLELRDKKGLAYTVRSSYETHANCANFSIYIGTEPNNIKVSLEGFTEEINKLKNELVPVKELEDAKTNLVGKWAFTRETNSQQSSIEARNIVIGLGTDFNEKLRERIKKVTVEDLKNCANKYFNDKYVLSIVKP